MKLQNPFPLCVRLLYLDTWQCWKCGLNGVNRGGLEIHHILGRISGSAFNSSVLCGTCHVHIAHNRETHQYLFARTIRFLRSICYQPTDEDWEFLRDNFRELVSRETIEWAK